MASEALGLQVSRGVGAFGGAAVAAGSARSRADWRLLRVGLVLLDAAALAWALTAAGLIRKPLDDQWAMSTLDPGRHLIAGLLMVPLILTFFRLQGLYQLDRILAGKREYARIGHAVTYGVVIAVAISYLAGRNPLISRSWLLLVWGLSIAAVVTGRFAARRLVRRLRRGGLLRTRIVVVGASTLGVRIAEQLREARDEGLDVVGFFDEYLPLGQPLLEGIKVIGRPRAIVSGAPEGLADEYVVVPQALPHERVDELTRLAPAASPVIRVALTSADLLTNGVFIAERGGVPMFRLERTLR